MNKLKIIITALILCFFTFTVSMAQSSSECNKKGIDFYNKGEYKEAVYWFTRALEKDPKSAKLWFNKGNACYKLAAYKSSQEESYKAVEKEFKNAIDCYNKALAYTREDSTTILFNKAIALFGLMSTSNENRVKEEAKECLNKILKVNPELKGLNINKNFIGGWSPISIACALGNEKLVEVLINKGVDVNSKRIDELDVSWTPLYSAGTKKIAELLIGAEAKVNIKNELGFTPLHTAVAKGFKDVVEVLLINGAKTDVKDFYGYTPLESAKRNKNSAIIDLLIKYGAKE
ncbi:MAG: ankyrin repeat domain-containing protein [Candidatus Eremiobacterota bacterium]